MNKQIEKIHKELEVTKEDNLKQQIEIIKKELVGLRAKNNKINRWNNEHLTYLKEKYEEMKEDTKHNEQMCNDEVDKIISELEQINDEYCKNIKSLLVKIPKLVCLN